jgi:hypothetical protein
MKTLIIIPSGTGAVIFDSFEKEPDVFLAIVWYSPEKPSDNILKMCDYVFYKSGPKWSLMSYALHSLKNIIYDFDYIWMPDDDLKFIMGSVVDLVSTMAKYNLELAQPSFIDKNLQYPIFKNIPGAEMHRTNFVEIQAPCFSKNALKKLQKTFDREDVKTGWGLDFVWFSILSDLLKDPLTGTLKGSLTGNLGCIDMLVMEHTRPAQHKKIGYQGLLNVDPMKEYRRTMSLYKVKRYGPKILEVIMSDPFVMKKKWINFIMKSDKRKEISEYIVKYQDLS